MVSYAFPLGIKTNGLVPRFVGYNLPGLRVVRGYVGPIKMVPRCRCT